MLVIFTRLFHGVLCVSFCVKTSESWELHTSDAKRTVLRLKPRGSAAASNGKFSFPVNNVLLAFSSSHSDLGAIVDISLKLRGKIERNAHIAGGIATILLSSTLLHSHNFIFSIFISQVSPKKEYAPCL